MTLVRGRQDSRKAAAAVTWRRSRFVWLLACVIFAASGGAHTTGAPPSAPANLSALVDGHDVKLAWQAPPDGGAPNVYVIEVSTAAGGPPILSAPVAGTEVVAPNVPDGIYFVRVRAANGDGMSAPSNEAVAVVPGGGGGCAAPPAPVENLTGEVNGNVVTLSWAPPSGACAAASYVVQVGTASGASDIAIINAGAVTRVSANGPDGTYHVRVVAVNGFGGSPSSRDVELRVPCDGCVSPQPSRPESSPPSPSPSPAPIDPGPSSPAPSAPPPSSQDPGGPEPCGDGCAPAPAPAPAPPPDSSSGTCSVRTAFAGTPASNGRLRMMTWNIHHGRDRSDSYVLAAQAEYIAGQDPDVVALQEVQTWDEDQPSRLKGFLERFTGVDWHVQWAPVIDKSATEGNVILTRLPVVSSTAHQMHATSDHDAMYSNRSAAQATVLVGCTPVHVFSTHLDYYNTSHRTAQLLDLMNWAEGFGARRIVGGDFNSWWGEYWPKTMGGDYRDTWHDITGDMDGGYTVNNAVRFDYLFRSISGADDVRPTHVEAPRTSLSDHNPVIADYQVRQ